MKNLQAQRPPSGFALVLVLVAIGICFLLLAGVLLWSSNSGQASLRHSEHYATLAAAEAATEKIVAQISDDFRTGGRTEVDNNLASYADKVPSAVEHAAWNNYEFVDDAGTPGRAYVAVATNWHAGPVNWQGGGLIGQSTTYRVVATARSRTASALSAAVLQDLEMAAVPLASFFMFAQPDLELSPGSGDWQINGPVHGNSSLYFSPNVSMTFADQVTAADQIVHHRSPEDSSGGGGGSISYLGVRQAEAGKFKLSVPGLPTLATNLWTFCRAQADLRITILSNTNLAATKKDGVSLSSWAIGVCSNYFLSTDPFNPTRAASTFVDKRECDVVITNSVIATVFDVGQFQTHAPSLGISPTPTSVYLEDSRPTTATTRFYAIKMVNARTLTAPFTLATPQPLYVQGSFNTNAQPAGLIADAVTVLSQEWDDADSALNLASRPATTTTINAAIITGNVPSQGGSYSGGFENLTRLLESWSGMALRFNGSLLLLFHSQIATEPWGMGDVYSPPNRIFRFAGQIGAGAPIVSNLQAEILVRSAWRTVPPGATE